MSSPSTAARNKRLKGHASSSAAKGSLLALSFGALGVVYGDIGTSPLYGLRESMGALAPTPESILGVMSLIFWSLVAVIVIKYLGFILQADNHGEGGILALLALSRGGEGFAPAHYRLAAAQVVEVGVRIEI